MLSGILVGVLTATQLPAVAIDANATVYGKEETVMVSSNASNARERNFNEGWKFYLGNNSSASNKNFNDSGWKALRCRMTTAFRRTLQPAVKQKADFCPAARAGIAKPLRCRRQTTEKQLC